MKFSFSNFKKKRVKILIYLFEFFGNKYDLIESYLSNNSNIYISKCFLNNELAAFILGEFRENTLYVFRIAINDKFSKYRPGILLMIDSIENISTNNKQIEFIDFSRGDESYKINFGGILHYNEKITIRDNIN